MESLERARPATTERAYSAGLWRKGVEVEDFRGLTNVGIRRPFECRPLRIAFESGQLSYSDREVDLYNSGVNQILSVAAGRGHALYHFRMADLYINAGIPHAEMSILALPPDYEGDPRQSHSALRVVETRPVPLAEIDIAFLRADDVRDETTPNLDLLRSMERHSTLIEMIDATLATCDKFELVRRAPEVPQPVTFAAETREAALDAIARVPRDHGFFVLKDRFGYGCGAQVHRLAFDDPHLDTTIDRYLAAYGRVLVQEFCPEVAHGDLVATFFDDRLIAPMRRLPASGEWRTNASLGGVEIACTLTPEQERIACAIRHRFPDCRYLSVDMLPSGKVLEVNAFPGGKGLWTNYGIAVGAIILDTLEAELEGTPVGDALVVGD